MPPKKAEKGEKKSGRKSGKEKAATIIDGLPITEMSREQLMGHIVRLRDEMEREREERNFFQLERDKIQTFWEICKRQLEETKAELRNREREVEETETRHQAEIQFHKQKVKLLLLEHRNNTADLKTENVVTQKQLQEQYSNGEAQQAAAQHNLKAKICEQERTYQDFVHSLRLRHQTEVAKLRKDFQDQILGVESKYEKILRAAREEDEAIKKSELQELEEGRKRQIEILTKNHDKSFTDMKNYYNDITLNNLALISTLKEQLEDYKKREDRLEKQLQCLRSENKRLVEPLKKTREEILDLRKNMATCEKDKSSLVTCKAKFKSVSLELKQLTWKYQLLEEKLQQVQTERDDLYSKFTVAIQEVHQKNSIKNALVEKKLDELESLLETKDAQLQQAMATCNISGNSVEVVNQKLQEMLESKNNTIHGLKVQLASALQSYDELKRRNEIRVAETKLEFSRKSLKLPELAGLPKAF